VFHDFRVAVLRTYLLWLLFTLLSVQLGDELERVKQEIEERGNSMADGGNVRRYYY